MSATLRKEKMPAIPTIYLPEDWRQQGADKFNCSESKIEKVVYGTRLDTTIYKFFVDLAERGMQEQSQLKERVIAIK